MVKPDLTTEFLIQSAAEFCKIESEYENFDLYGTTDGKAIGTFIEHKFQKFLEQRYRYVKGSSAKGIDLPGNKIQTDIKVTSIRQPQSSSSFKDAKQKIFGLGYNLLEFVYDKTDHPDRQYASLDFLSCSYLDRDRTGDYTTTFRLRQMIEDGANHEDIVAYLNDRRIPADHITLGDIASQLLERMPKQGYLTISNALQWRLQYSRIVNLKNPVEGIVKIINKV